MHISCTICTELYLANEETAITKCGHLFHMDCLKPWLQKHKTCPHCRANTTLCDLRRVFFTEISDEDVHLNRNCKIDSWKAIVASEKELVGKIKMDLRQSQNDLIDMNKHIERYENEIKNLKLLNESLLENNVKIERDNIKLNEQVSYAAITSKNNLASDIEIENFNFNWNEEQNTIIELKTIIESYEEARKRDIINMELLKQQINVELSQKQVYMIKNEQLQHELQNLKEEKNENEKTVLHKKEENLDRTFNKFKKNLKNNQRECFPGTHISSPQIKLDNTKASKESEATTSKKARCESFRKAREEISKLKSCPLSETDISYLPGANGTKNANKKKKNSKTCMADKSNDSVSSNKINEILSRSESFRKARAEIAKLKSCPLPDADSMQTQLELKGDKLTALAVAVNRLKAEGMKKFVKSEGNVQKKLKSPEIITNTNNEKTIEPESPISKHLRSESFRKTREKFTIFSNSDKNLNDVHTLSVLKEHKHTKSPMPPPRALKSSMTIRPPCPPPRTRTDHKFEKNELNEPPKAQRRTLVDEHPLAIDRVIRKPPAGSIPLLGLFKNERLESEKVIPPERKSFENDDISSIQKPNSDEEEQTLIVPDNINLD